MKLHESPYLSIASIPLPQIGLYNENPIEAYFNLHREVIELMIEQQIEKTRRNHRDNLTYENVIAEVILRLADVDKKITSNDLITKTIDSVIKESAQDKKTREFTRKNRLSSEFDNTQNPDSDVGKFILESTEKTPEEMELGDRTCLVGRASLLKLRRVLAPSQQTLLAHLSGGLSMEEISGRTGRSIEGIEDAIKLITVRAFERLTDTTPHESIDKEKWAKQDETVKKIADLYLLGLDGTIIMEETGVTNQGEFTKCLGEAKIILDLTTEQVASIRRENMKKQGDIEAKDEKRFFKFLDPNDTLKISMEEKENISAKRDKLLGQLASRQKETIELYIQGNRRGEIALLTQRSVSQVAQSLSIGKRVLLGRIAQLKNLPVPEGIDPINWLKVEPQGRKVVNYFIRGFDDHQIAKTLGNAPATINVLFNNALHALGLERENLLDLQIAHTTKERKQNPDLNKRNILEEVFGKEEALTNPDEVVKTICKLFKALDPKTNLRVFKLRILGLRKFHIARVLNLGTRSVIKSLEKIAAGLKRKILECQEAPQGLDPYRWVTLSPRSKNFLTLALEGHDDETIFKLTSYKKRSVRDLRWEIREAIKHLGLAEDRFRAICEERKTRLAYKP